MNLWEWIAAILGLVLTVGIVYAIGCLIMAVVDIFNLMNDDHD